MLYEPADRRVNARYDESPNRSFALLKGLQPVRGFLIVDNYAPPNQPFENSLAGEMMVFDFGQGAAWGYQAYNAAPLTELDTANSADPLYVFEDGAERSGEVLAGNRALTPTALNGGVSPAVPVAIMPVVASSENGVATRFFVTPIGHSITFPAGTVANPAVINNQTVIGPRHQGRGDLTTEVLLTVNSSNRVANNDVFFDRDENPVSGRVPRSVTCVAALDVTALLSEGALGRVGQSGGWTALAVRSPGPLAELSGESNRPLATRTANTNQATVIKLEFSPNGRFLGQLLFDNAFNNAIWLRHGIRESIQPVANDSAGLALPRVLIRDVLDERQKFIDVGQDFSGDSLELRR